MAAPVKKASSAAPAKAGAAKKGSKADRLPNLRDRCQQGYELLRELLGRTGHKDLADQLKPYDNVDDLMKHHPELVGFFLSAAWELREEKRFQELFQQLDVGGLVTTTSQPIAPCGRTFEEVIQAHLYGAARLYFERLETHWAAARAKEEGAKYQRRMQKKKKTLTGLIVGSIKELAMDAPKFTADQYREEYLSYGLYDLLKPYLTSADQFRLIPYYARLQTRQVEELGELITYFNNREELEMLANLKPEDIGQAKGFARVYAEMSLNISRHQVRMNAQKNKKRDPEEEADELARLKKLPAEERRVFELLLTTYIDCLGPMREAGGGADNTVRRLGPIFKEEVFALFRDPERLRNAINCPDFALKLIGTSSQFMRPEVGETFNQLQNRDLARDLLKIAVEEIDRPELERFISDPSLQPIWYALPAKFNNNYRYQADAPDDSNSLRNYSNLQMVSEGIFESLRTGRMDAMK